MHTVADITDAWEPHPWVAEGSRSIRFGIDLWPQPDLSALIHGVRLAERLGFDSYWKEDHPVYGPDVWITLAVLARATTTIRLGSFVSCVYYRHPVVLARMARDIDRLSQGRLVLGLGIGAGKREFAHLGLPFPSTVERQGALEETVQIVRGMWKGESFSFTGQTFSVNSAPACPVPLQQPRVPILIAGGGERVTLRSVAQYADASNFGPLKATGDAVTLDDVRRKLQALRRHCEDRGRSYDSVLRTHITFPLVLAKTQDTLEAKLTRFPKELGFAGTPEDAIAYYRSLVDLGLRYFITVIHPDDRETIHLLASRVMAEMKAG